MSVNLIGSAGFVPLQGDMQTLLEACVQALPASCTSLALQEKTPAQVINAALIQLGSDHVANPQADRSAFGKFIAATETILQAYPFLKQSCATTLQAAKNFHLVSLCWDACAVPNGSGFKTPVHRTALNVVLTNCAPFDNFPIQPAFLKFTKQALELAETLVFLQDNSVTLSAKVFGDQLSTLKTSHPQALASVAALFNETVVLHKQKLAQARQTGASRTSSSAGSAPAASVEKLTPTRSDWFWKSLLGRLLSALANAFRKLKNTATDKGKNAERELQLRQQRLALFRELFDILLKAGPNEALINRILTLLHQSQCTKDREFLFKIAQYFATSLPEFLVKNLTQFPLSNKEDIRRLGAYLENNDHRGFFAAHFKLTVQERAELESTRESYLKNLKEMTVGLLGHGGNCHGYTLALVGQTDPRPTQDTLKKARFIQMADKLERSLPRISFHEITLLGIDILNAPEKYPLSLQNSATILGYENENELAADFKAEKAPANMAYLVGKFSLQHTKKLLAIADANKKTEESNNSVAKSLLEFAKRLQNSAREKPENLENIEAALKEFQEAQECFAKIQDIREHSADLMEKTTGIYNECLSPLVAQSSSKASNKWLIPIIKQLKLMPAKVVVAKTPLAELESHLKSLKSRKGKFYLFLQPMDDNGLGHALYLSFSPPHFSDINDNDLTQSPIPQLREGFKTADEMISALIRHLAVTYPKSQYGSFILSHYSSTRKK